MILGVLGVAEITGVIPGGMSDAPPNVVAVRGPMRTPLPSIKCPLCGTVESIRTVELRVLPEGAGAVGVSGTAVARPIGPEKDSTMTPGAVAEPAGGRGSEGEKDMSKRFAYRITVRMDDGSYRTISQPTPPALAVGDKVRVVEGRLVRT